MTLDVSGTVPPPAASYTLDEVPMRRRFPIMREMMADGHPPFMRAVLTATRDDPDAPFDGGFILRTKGGLGVCEHYSQSVSYMRTAAGAAATPIADYGIFLLTEGVWHLAQGERQHTLTAGSMVLMDSNVPFLSVKPGWAKLLAIRIPHRRIDPLIPDGWQRHGVVCPNTPGLGSLVTHYAKVLTEEMDGLSAAEADLALDHLCRLFALYADGQDGEPAGPALAAARLAQIRRHIDFYLADPDLTPASVAAALHISVRALHLLFEPTGASFARYVQERRLYECRAMLTSPTHADRSVTDIAFACGFNSLSTFYRAFQGRFGAAPGELRGASGVTEGGIAGGLGHAGYQTAG